MKLIDLFELALSFKPHLLNLDVSQVKHEDEIVLFFHSFM